jgi:hypothetical protein
VADFEKCKPIPGGVASIYMTQAGVWSVLRGLDVAVYGVLLAHSDAFTGQVTKLSVATIAREVLAGERPVQKALAALASKHVIRIVPGGGRHVVNEYQIEIDPAAIAQAVAGARAAFQSRCKSKLAAAETKRKHRQHVDGVSVGGEVPKPRQHVDTVSEPDTPSPGDGNPVTETQKPRHRAMTRQQKPRHRAMETPSTVDTPTLRTQQQKHTETPGTPPEAEETRSFPLSAAAAGAAGAETETETAGTTASPACIEVAEPETSIPPEIIAEFAELTRRMDVARAAGNGNGALLLELAPRRAAIIRRFPVLEPPLSERTATPEEHPAAQATPAVAEPEDSGRFAIAHALVEVGCDEAFSEEVQSRFSLDPVRGLDYVRWVIGQMQASETPVRRPGAWLRRFLQREGLG